MSTPARRVALFGGTFDPIHLGHLAAARAALHSGLVDEVVFIPGGTPPHKRGPRHSSEDRWCMTVLATLDEPAYHVARWEIDRPGPSFAVDTVRQAITDLTPFDGRGLELYWVIGTDAMALIDTWHDVETLFSLTRFMVVTREGMNETALRARLAETIPWAVPESVVFVPMAPVNISSTELRTRLAAGDPATDALPRPVSTYIQRYQLYRQPQEAHR